jgi:hypothetical protein
MLFIMVKFFSSDNDLLSSAYSLETNSIQTNFLEDALFTGKIIYSY